VRDWRKLFAGSPPERRPKDQDARADNDIHAPHLDVGDDEVEFSSVAAEEVGAVEPAAPKVIERVSRPRVIAARDRGERISSAPTRWSALLAAALMVGGVIFVWSALHATERAQAEPILARSLVPITEIDALLSAESDTLIAEAQRRPGELLTTPHYPLPVTLPADELALLSPTALRARLLSDSARLVYDDGVGVFRREAGSADGGFFSARGVIRWTLGRLTADTHDILWLLFAATLIFAIPALIIAIALSHSRDRLRNLGLAVLLGGLLTTIATISARFALRTTAEGAADPLNMVLLHIGADVLSIPLRNAVIVSVLGAAILALGLAAQSLERRSGPNPRVGR